LFFPIGSFGAGGVDFFQQLLIQPAADKLFQRQHHQVTGCNFHFLSDRLRPLKQLFGQRDGSFDIGHRTFTCCAKISI
jgi:hypothetical protein